MCGRTIFKFNVGQKVSIDPSLDPNSPTYDMSEGTVTARFPNLRDAIAEREGDKPLELREALYRGQVEDGLPGDVPWYQLTPAGIDPRPRMSPETHLRAETEEAGDDKQKYFVGDRVRINEGQGLNHAGKLATVVLTFPDLQAYINWNSERIGDDNPPPVYMLAVILKVSPNEPVYALAVDGVPTTEDGDYAMAVSDDITAA